MNSFSLEKPVPYHEQFYHSLKKMIFEGELKPGERINETQLAKEFNVSRSPIREAMRVLEKEGLLITDERSRTLVYKPSLRDVKEVYFCRMALESFAVGLTIKNATDAELDAIEKTLEDTEQAINHMKDIDNIINLNETFHNLIIKSTRNLLLQKQIDDLKSLMYWFRTLNFQGENRAISILNEHRKILVHIKNKEEQKASEAMLNHLRLDLAHLLEVFPKSIENPSP
ncbi:GntR family transcriptional regulator [Priestia megaterium]|uniref:GntR family transcriptional regulator n=1 Tax=Priestia megaterium TaxID=1404 RepID=UPI000BF321CE|nr:GntR family transcriptional regulator [Priestia megaterium]PFO12698.1 GntR family transcriptional regulator [Priestia megaterium]